MNIKTYSELSKLKTFKERFQYLKLSGKVGEDTFGFDRWFNQKFYKDPEWLAVRDLVIIRDNGCDLGTDGFEIYGRILVHHMNPISLDDIKTRSRFLLDPEHLISTAHSTHNAIHYGDESLLYQQPTERTLNDTCPWRQAVKE